ncbi:hypothetical protein XELAEV_18001018mg [Xenopus laevis]|nr:hypothetical protein XELAEV_18001018mg [Xenopus laevis]
MQIRQILERSNTDPPSSPSGQFPSPPVPTPEAANRLSPPVPAHGTANRLSPLSPGTRSSQYTLSPQSRHTEQPIHSLPSPYSWSSQ